MTYTKNDIGIFDSLKVGHLADAIGASVETAVGHLHRFWAWAMKHRPDGIIGECSARDLGRMANWPVPETYGQALIAYGFVETVPEGFAIHDWMEYAGTYVDRLRRRRRLERQKERRTQDRHRQRKHREKLAVTHESGGKSGGRGGGNSVTSRDLSQNNSQDFRNNIEEIPNEADVASGKTHLRSRSRSDQSQIFNRDHEEIINVDLQEEAYGAEPPADGRSTQQSDDRPKLVLVPDETPVHPPSVVIFPTLPGARNGPREWALTVTEAKRLGEAFPAVDVKREAKAMLAWLLANPTKKKTAGGMLRFVTGWLMREQNRGRNIDAPKNADDEKPKRDPLQLREWSETYVDFNKQAAEDRAKEAKIKAEGLPPMDWDAFYQQAFGRPRPKNLEHEFEVG